MNPQIKEKWVTALESGQYQQGKGVLKQTVDGVSSFCCLGVLCELYIKETGKGSWENIEGSPIGNLRNAQIFNDGVAENVFSVTRLVSNWADYSPDLDQVESISPGGNRVCSMLASLNDGNDTRVNQHTFAEIAKIIKEQL